ncbi:hypothetical protein N7492_003568 [Penicillium capsulatum]|uniref:RNase MRP protein 1 RNA binding domain-containing protein n=1 Tax=Penicillium capsulatum TaxID=69766 RepID=A0A9W9IJN7_9EURO|nr:hypothetical protein N7492_003568 [Penicillium capsulatum]KAJ6121849.1 hypothetical protein N7512_004314 [Penicillium capsulatum]
MDNDEIHAVQSILHLIFHRNKNQHARAKWWRWLSMLKRITSDLASPGLSPSAAESYRQHLAKNLIPKSYVAFSTVIADNQFSTLGIVLMAALGRLAKVTGANRRLETRVKSSSKTSSAVAPVEDRGEVISRGSGNSDATSGAGSRQTRQEPPKPKPRASGEKTSVSSIKKNSKRKKNAIDDLFSGLL